jgi:predicted mannosyl-3-phosphoglycerate phosphatase (HAD superfamily)
MLVQEKAVTRNRVREGGASSTQGSATHVDANSHSNEDQAIAWLLDNPDLAQAEQFVAVIDRFGLDTIEAMCALHGAAYAFLREQCKGECA